MQITLLNNFYTFTRTCLFGGFNNSSLSYTNSSCYTYNSGLNYTYKKYCIGNLVDTNGSALDYINVLSSNNATATEWSHKDPPSEMFFGHLTFGCFNGNNNNTSQSGYTYFSVGSGITPVSLIDYELASPYTSSDITVGIGASYFEDIESGLGRIAFNLTLTNVSNETKTINELGFNKCVNNGDGVHTDQITVKKVLLGRTVLDSPITLQAGQKTSIQVYITL